MKLLIISILAFFCFNVAHGQTYVSFPDSNAVWINEYCTDEWDYSHPSGTPQFLGCFPEHYSKIAMNNEDTVISGHQYSKLFLMPYGDYIGGIRDSAMTVHFLPKDSIQELLMYDFDVSVGDSVDFYTIYDYGLGYPTTALTYAQASPFAKEVNYVDSILIGSDFRKVIHIGDMLWVEGVGNQTGLFWDSGSNVSGYGTLLSCMSKNDTTYFPTYDSGQGCQLNVDVIEKNRDLNQVTIFPNPTYNQFSVKWQSNNNEVLYQLYSIVGRLLKEGVIENEGTIDVSSLSAGRIILRLENSAYSIIKQ